MGNRDTHKDGEKGAAAGKATAKADTAVEQAGSSTSQDKSIEEERQRRQENWSPAGQTGFDNEDVERQEEIYPREPSSEAENSDQK